MERYCSTSGFLCTFIQFLSQQVFNEDILCAQFKVGINGIIVSKAHKVLNLVESQSDGIDCNQANNHKSIQIYVNYHSSDETVHVVTLNKYKINNLKWCKRRS